jgi:hypothetical protein
MQDLLWICGPSIALLADATCMLQIPRGPNLPQPHGKTNTNSPIDRPCRDKSTYTQGSSPIPKCHQRIATIEKFWLHPELTNVGSATAMATHLVELLSYPAVR